jgi:hypothetical protein
MTYDPANRDSGSDGPGFGTLMFVLLLVVTAGSIYFAINMRRQATLAAIRAEHQARYQAEQARAELERVQAQAPSVQPVAIDDEPSDPVLLAERLERALEEKERLRSEVAAIDETIAELQRRLDEADGPESDRAVPVP